MEVRVDATSPEMRGFRWLTVGPVGQPDVELALMAIGGTRHPSGNYIRLTQARQPAPA
jgi:hypothetical protein